MLGSNISRLMNKCEPIISCVIATIHELCSEDLDLPLPATNVFTIGLGSWQLCCFPLYNALSPKTKKNQHIHIIHHYNASCENA